MDILIRRLDNLTDRVIRFEEQTQINVSQLIRGQTLMTQLLRQLTEGQAEIAQTQSQLATRQGLMEETIRRLEEGQELMREIQTSLAAGQERQERILDYLLRRVNGENPL
ncbi:hypothetical protein BCD67_15890 [Oscillatoriales cyanobacterium USR001]|nr:hypothetical protein BCD67_15890 [Oscillatoriales cyanobacterium USR001]